MIVKSTSKDTKVSDEPEKGVNSDIFNNIEDKKQPAQKNELYRLDSDFDIHYFVSMQTTSPTIEKEADVFRSDDDVTVLNDNSETSEVETKSDDNKTPISLSENELEFFAELIVEFLDWAFGKIMDMTERRYEKTSLAQKKRLVDAFVRVGIKYDIKLTPEISLIVLILITYGVKGMKSTSKKKPEKRSVKESNDVISKALHKDDEKTEKTKKDILKEVKESKKGILD